MIVPSTIKVLIFLFAGFGTIAHPYYVSIFQINHNAEQKTLQITCKIFTDDLEKAIESQGTNELRLGSEQELAKADEYIGRYIREHFQISVNGKQKEMHYLGKEVELDVTWCYLEISGISSISSIAVKNDILFDQYRTQTNIIHTEIGDQQKSVILKKENPSHSFIYDG
jgi:hypothetical protein